MEKPSAVSPFAALTSQQQKEQWICWQSQKQTVETIEPAKPTNVDEWSELVSDDAKPTVSLQPTRTHHSQYNAVLARMKQAQKRANAYIDC